MPAASAATVAHGDHGPGTSAGGFHLASDRFGSLLAGGIIGLLFIRPERDRKRLAAHAIADLPLQPAQIAPFVPLTFTV